MKYFHLIFCSMLDSKCLHFWLGRATVAQFLETVHCCCCCILISSSGSDRWVLFLDVFMDLVERLMQIGTCVNYYYFIEPAQILKFSFDEYFCDDHCVAEWMGFFVYLRMMGANSWQWVERQYKQKKTRAFEVRDPNHKIVDVEHIIRSQLDVNCSCFKKKKRLSFSRIERSI